MVVAIMVIVCGRYWFVAVMVIVCGRYWFVAVIVESRCVIVALFPSPLSIARRGSSVSLQVNSSSVWSRLRAVNMSVSNFVSSSSSKILRTKSTVAQHEERTDVTVKQDIGRCVSLPDLKQKFLRSMQRSALLPGGDESVVSESC